jgi:hypothetical protein
MLKMITARPIPLFPIYDFMTWTGLILPSPLPSPDIIKRNKSRRMRQAGYVTCNRVENLYNL